MHQEKCVKTCPTGYTSLSGNCAKCTQSDCVACKPDSPNKCTKCQAPALLLDNVCLKTCPAKTFSNGVTCVNCHATCADCVDRKTCKKCVVGFTLEEDGKCHNTCPVGKVRFNNMCVACADNKCAACSTDINKCLKCIAPFKLYKNRCVSTCPRGYRDGADDTCVKCPIGCASCDKKGTCQNCSNGFYFIKAESRCVIHCPKGFFANCDKKECTKCDAACDECVGGSAKECIKCAAGFFKDDRTCVVPAQCSTGTYPDTATKECERCKLPYCKHCSDKFTCATCTRGFVLNKNKCEIAKTFTNIIKGIQIFDHFSFSKRREREIISISTGVSSSSVSFNFWIKLLAPLKPNGTNNLVSIKSSTKTTYDYVLRVNAQSKKCELNIVSRAGQVHKTLVLGDCSYGKLYNWKFFNISIVQKYEDFKITVKTRKNSGKVDIKKFALLLSGNGEVSEIIEKNTKVVFNDNSSKTIVAYNVYNFNVFDYVVSETELKKFSEVTPSSCDYFCTECNVTCKKCNDGLPSQDGYCRATEISVIKGVKVIKSTDAKDVRYDLNFNSNKAFDSDRYAFATWFYIDSSAAAGAFTVFQDYYLSNEKNNKVVIDKNQIIVNDNAAIEVAGGIQAEQWYFIAVGWSKTSYRIWLYGQSGNSIIKKQVTYAKRVRFVRIWNSWEFNFNVVSGSVLNSAVYINNVPEDFNIEKSVKDFKFPNFCTKTDKTLVCQACVEGYRLTDQNKCVIDINININKAINRIDLWDTETAHAPAKDALASDEYSVSVWFRKKTHSYLSATATNKKELPKTTKTLFNLLGLSTASGEFVSLISIENKENFTSDLKFSPAGPQPALTVSHKFTSEVYNYIHVTISVKKSKKSITYEVQDFSTGKTYSKVDNLVDPKFFTNAFESFVVGDKDGFEVNMEVSWLQYFQAPITKSTLAKIRNTRPKDCNAACKTSCDLDTGICQECGNGTKNTLVCPTFLLGYKVSYLYSASNPTYASLNNVADYLNQFTNVGFTWGVNSNEYSLLGYVKVFDFDNTQGKDARYRILSIGNRKKVHYTDDAGEDIVAFDVVASAGKATIEFILNGSGKRVTHKVADVNVEVDSWLAFHAGVDVKNKKFRYKFYNVATKKYVVGGESFLDFPESLQQKGGISLLGVQDTLSAKYLVPSVRMHETYVIPNSGFDEALFAKFLDKFKLPAETVCPKNCSRCITNKSGKVECLKCNKAYKFQNGVCNPDRAFGNYPLLVLSDNKVITAPTKYVIKASSQAIFNGVSTLSFFVRRNYFSGAKRKILSYGKIEGYVSIDKSNSDYFELVVLGTDVKFSVKLGEESMWYSISITINGSVITVNVSDEKDTQGVDSISKTLAVKTVLTPSGEFSVDPNNAEFQLFGVHIANMDIDGPTLSWPKVNCGIDCNFCQENSCKSCVYGLSKDKKGCATKNVQFNIENNYVSMRLSTLLGKNLALRSDHYSAIFVAETSLSGVVELFQLNNDNDVNNDANPSEHIFMKYNTETYTFYIGYTTRSLLTKTQSAEIKEVKYTQKPTKSEHFVGFAVDGDVLRYVIFNTQDNYIKGEIKFQGKMDYITLNTNLHFFGKKPAKAGANPGLIQHTRFFYEKAITFDYILNRAKLFSDMVQKSCKEGTKYNCKVCKSGFLKSGLCVPTKNAGVLIAEDVMPINRGQGTGKVFKYNFENGSPALSSFTLNFWFRPTALLTTNQGIANSKLVSKGETKDIYSLTFTPKNTLMIGYPVADKIKTVHIADFIKTEELFEWIYISAVVDITKKTHSITVTHQGTKRNIVREESIKDLSLSAAGLDVSTSATFVVYAGSTDKLIDTTDNVSFELSYMTFIPNFLLTGKADEEFRTVCPNIHHKPCMSKRVNLVCAEKDRLKAPINIGDLLSGTEAQKTADLSWLESIPLFRPIVLDPTYAQSFFFFQVSFELDVAQYLAHQYTANKDVLLAIHSNNKLDFETMSMNTVIPESLSKFGSLSFVVNKGALTVYNGYVPWTNTVSSFEVPLGGKPISAFSKIYFSILFDNQERTVRLVVIADNVVFNLDINQNSFAAPITFNSLVYSHPVFEKINLNLFNPRLIKDVQENASAHLNTEFKNNSCAASDKNCKTCLVNQEGKGNYCMNCKDGFVYFEGSCKDAFVLPVSQK
jgi:hypothetical protein